MQWCLIKHRDKFTFMVLKDTGWKGGNWIYLAQDRDQWRAFVKMVMNFLVLGKDDNFLTE